MPLEKESSKSFTVDVAKKSTESCSSSVDKINVFFLEKTMQSTMSVAQNVWITNHLGKSDFLNRFTENASQEAPSFSYGEECGAHFLSLMY